MEKTPNSKCSNRHEHLSFPCCLNLLQKDPVALTAVCGAFRRTVTVTETECCSPRVQRLSAWRLYQPHSSAQQTEGLQYLLIGHYSPACVRSRAHEHELTKQQKTISSSRNFTARFTALLQQICQICVNKKTHSLKDGITENY